MLPVPQGPPAMMCIEKKTQRQAYYRHTVHKIPRHTLFFTGSVFAGVTEIILTGFSSFSLTPVSDISELCSLGASWKT